MHRLLNLSSKRVAQEHQNQFQHFYEKWLNISIQTNLEQHTGHTYWLLKRLCTVKLIGYLKDYVQVIGIGYLLPT